MKTVLKSIFISIFPVIALYFVIDSVIHLINHGISYRYIGRLMVSVTIASFFLGLFIKPVARTEANPKFYTLLIAIGFIISLIAGGIIQQDFLGSLPTVGLFIGWILYIKWYSTFENRKENTVIKVGKLLPELNLQDPDKNEINTSMFMNNPSIFLFYRGNWCPLCMAQIKEIASQYKELEKRNVNVVFISPQPHKHTKSLAKKFELNFIFLIDQGNKVARQLNIFAKNGIPMGFQTLGYNSDTVMPTVIITDNNGKIIFSDLTDNYRVRPEPETFIKVLDQHIV
ncbi:peroxiredoxin family protein [Aquimarina sp. 2201CG5-10]|uniref:peroxiredoxin family protein n=1 Tax=Aquimarina callyspongiae TaxID=3098150 RepID=UPI002AB43D56|nr:peroxiredoxin family protein [Aquimarina sp. 2201CG5-10]MDY8138520.1 peroxiredoxin family protein [Aquimarina sp. 2201CG5-10]